MVHLITLAPPHKGSWSFASFNHFVPTTRICTQPPITLWHNSTQDYRVLTRMKEARDAPNDRAGENHDTLSVEDEQSGSYANTKQHCVNALTATDKAERFLSAIKANMDAARAAEAVLDNGIQTASTLKKIQNTLAKEPLVTNPSVSTGYGTHIKFQKVWEHEFFLNLIGEVDKKMHHFREYIETQKDNGKPLYRWDKYTEYRAIHHAVYGVDREVSQFKSVSMPHKVVEECIARAMAHSTSVSKAVAYVLRVISEKTAAYTEELEGSTLSDEAKASATAYITAEVQKLLEHSTKAAGCVWAATDLLRELDQEDAPKPAFHEGWIWSLGKFLLTAGFSAAIGIVTAQYHLYGPASVGLAHQGAHGTGLYNQVLALVQQSQANTNLTSEIYTVKLHELDQRYDTLAELAESHGLRIDNLVDSLGPTNAEGVYYSSTPKAEEGARSGIGERVLKALEDAQRQLQRQQNEMEAMRKNMNRMDIRLTKRIDKIR
jgi:hypothetical protein